MLIMCHPATEAYPDDEIAQQRVVEYRYFTSEKFTGMLAAAQLRLERLSIQMT